MYVVDVDCYYVIVYGWSCSGRLVVVWLIRVSVLVGFIWNCSGNMFGLILFWYFLYSRLSCGGRCRLCRFISMWYGSNAGRWCFGFFFLFLW